MAVSTSCPDQGSKALDLAILRSESSPALGVRTDPGIVALSQKLAVASLKATFGLASDVMAAASCCQGRSPAFLALSEASWSLDELTDAIQKLKGIKSGDAIGLLEY
ncbi:hypothetical protein AK812_SmicGene38939 [Symbiodinium microadriaticum]|uniref:Uncharacterized protein n=1 Tax=Symbiodinium microadriaticum TaxID=2951 RepID=A0A1Q9CCH1_SYMMI|nr:hypothetical protein AK812_SmicGene38939 [Symbiodinium microadriaticum]CAE7668343.1 unnamed protein product [Symbiodinium microadriaticum]CAE7939499.1 unnamed protein product [Symbiodinium sp. KB8]